MTEDTRLRLVERDLAVHLAECGIRQKQILDAIREMKEEAAEAIRDLREEGRSRDGKLGRIALGVWSAVSALGALLGWAWWPAVASAIHKMAGG